MKIICQLDFVNIKLEKIILNMLRCSYIQLLFVTNLKVIFNYIINDSSPFIKFTSLKEKNVRKIRYKHYFLTFYRNGFTYFANVSTFLKKIN